MNYTDIILTKVTELLEITSKHKKPVYLYATHTSNNNHPNHTTDKTFEISLDEHPQHDSPSIVVTPDDTLETIANRISRLVC